MPRNDLLENNYRFEKKEQYKTVINLLWLFFTALFVAPAAVMFALLIKDDADTMEFSAAVINIIFISTPLVYFFTKAILTYSFCSGDKKVYLKLTSFGMPVWACREAFRAKQIILMYLPPVVSIYPVLLILSIMSGGELYLFVLIIIMSFFMAYDVVLILYILFFKIKYKTEYIAIDNHVYNLTFYYEDRGENKNIAGPDSRKKYKPEKEIKFKLPKFNFSKIKINNHVLLALVGLLVFAGFASLIFIGFYIYNSNEKIPGNNINNSSGAVIKGYTGSPFADPDIFLDGDYTGFESLVKNNIIFCGDDGSIIYYNGEKKALMCLTPKELKKLCVYEKCRNDLSGRCGHMPDFVSCGCYSDGYLYGAVNLHGVQNGFIVRYDIVLNTAEKFIEFDLSDEYVYIQNMLVYGRYLYVVVSTEDSAYLTVVRIDLENEDACILYSDGKDAKNKEKAAGLTHIYENYIISIAPGYIYKCDLDMKNFETLTSADNIKQLEIYGDYIYYCNTENRKLFRYNIKSNKEEFLLDNVLKFCADGGFLYYTLREPRETTDKLGVLVSSGFYEDNIIYRAQLDGEYIDFYNKTAVYKPEHGYYFGEWSVKYGYVYTLLYSDNNCDVLSREYLNSSSGPYIFWEKTLK